LNILFSNITFGFTLLFCGIVGTCTPTLYAQTQTTAFDSVYLDIAINTLESDIDKALWMTDSLYQNSQNNLERIKSALLMALIYNNKGELSDAFYWATKSENIAIKEKNYDYQVRSAGYLATLYRNVGLITESVNHLKIAEKANSKRKSESSYHSIQGVIHHERYYHEIDKNNYEKALSELKKYKKCLMKGADSATYSSSLSTAAMHESFAATYILLNEYKKAKESAETSFRIINDRDPQLVCLLNNHFGAIELHNKNYEKAIIYLQKAEEYADQSQHLAIKFPTYSKLAQYYKEIGDFEKSIHYADKAADVERKQIENIKQISNETLARFQNKETKIIKSNQYLIWIVVLLTLSITSILVLGRMKIKRQNARYKKLMKRYKSVQFQINNNELDSKTNSEADNSNQNNFIITQETETRILEQLNILESKKFFLNKDLTLSSLTTELNSNARYVSQIIKTHKNNDFNGYINELRVFYVIRLWSEQPKYLNYKFSEIANKAGFASHSRFSVVFKSVTGLTPSAFLLELKKEKQAS